MCGSSCSCRILAGFRKSAIRLRPGNLRIGTMQQAWRKAFWWTALLAAWPLAAAAADGPDCSRPLSLALHDHGLLYSADTSMGIDKDIADELMRRSGCK